MKPLVVNLGYSVLDMVKAFEKVPYKIVDRRATCFAKEILAWESKKGIDDMCIDGRVII